MKLFVSVKGGVTRAWGEELIEGVKQEYKKFDCLRAFGEEIPYGFISRAPFDVTVFGDRVTVHNNNLNGMMFGEMWSQRGEKYVGKVGMPFHITYNDKTSVERLDLVVAETAEAPLLEPIWFLRTIPRPLNVDSTTRAMPVNDAEHVGKTFVKNDVIDVDKMAAEEPDQQALPEEPQPENKRLREEDDETKADNKRLREQNATLMEENKKLREFSEEVKKIIKENPTGDLLKSLDTAQKALYSVGKVYTNFRLLAKFVNTTPPNPRPDGK